MTESLGTFSAREKIHFTRVLPHQNTVCKVVVSVKSTSQTKTFQNVSVSSDKGHAEVLALLAITKDLMKYLHQTNITRSNSAHESKDTEIVEFDLDMRLNNSPCHLSGCQSFITYWIEHVILSLIPGVSQVTFCFNLYFSNLYTEKGTSAINKLKEWAVKLVGLGIFVFFYPILVSQTFKIKKKDVNRTINSDLRLKTKYFALLEEFNKLHIISVSNSDGFESKKNNLKTLGLEPQFICISPPKEERKGRNRPESSEPAKGSYSAKDTAMKSSKRTKYSED